MYLITRYKYKCAIRTKQNLNSQRNLTNTITNQVRNTRLTSKMKHFVES